MSRDAEDPREAGRDPLQRAREHCAILRAPVRATVETAHDEVAQRAGQVQHEVVDGGRVVGYASWTRDGDGAELNALYVLPEAWGRGVGAHGSSR